MCDVGLSFQSNLLFNFDARRVFNTVWLDTITETKLFIVHHLMLLKIYVMLMRLLFFTERNQIGQSKTEEMFAVC